MLPRVLPMKAVTGELPTSDDGWAYEIKWDGMRIVAYVGDRDRAPLRLETSRGGDAAIRFPELAPLVEALASHEVILDGEIVAFANDRPSFERLTHRMHLSKPAAIAARAADIPIVYVVFDLLHVDGEDLTTRPYLERRARLAELVSDGVTWRVPGHYLDDGAGLLEVVRERRLEGLVAKRLDSPYVAGRRSPSWRKVKAHGRQELVVGGWVAGSGSLSGMMGACCWASTTRASCATRAGWGPGSPSPSAVGSSAGWSLCRQLINLSTRHRRQKRSDQRGGCAPSLWSR